MSSHSPVPFLVLMTVLPVGFGVALLIPAVRAIRTVRRLRLVGVPVSGVVVDNQVRAKAKGGVLFAPVVSFRTNDGRDICAVAYQHSLASLVVGSSVALRYDPDRPEHFLAGEQATGVAGNIVAAAAVFAFALFVMVTALRM